MASADHPGGVPGTIGVFNFIRRIGFPPTVEVVSVFITMTSLAIILGLPLYGLSLQSSLLIALAVVILPTLVGELLNSTVFLRGDPVLDFRRLMGMELVSWSVLLVLLPVSSLIGYLAGQRNLWTDGLLIALAVSLPVRFLTIFAMSSLRFWRKLIAAFLIPLASFRAYAGVSIYLSLQSLSQIVPGLLTLLCCLLLSGISVWLTIRGVDKVGGPEIGDAPMPLFRDFLRHWLRADPGPLEERLANLGCRGRIDVSNLAFETSNGSRSCIIVSNFHPGPYRDLGSGGLPSKLKASIEANQGSIALVPHGISNHEFNIISKNDIGKLIDETKRKYPESLGITSASKLVREAVGEASASAQAFGDTVLLTLTLAPRDMEDIPSDVFEEVEGHAKGKGLHVIAIDAHNSLTHQTSITSGQAQMLKEAAIRALDKASRQPQSSFRLGAASDPLSEFNIEDGIGPGGLSTVIIDSQGQLAAYLTIDGNNMETGLRQTILSDMRDDGIDDGEVMTTDTHLVAGVVRSRLGYHPVGENMNKTLLLAKARETLLKARSMMGKGSAGFSTLDLDLQVLGSSSFQKITSFVGRVARGIGRSFLRLELAVFALSIVLLVVL